MFTIKQVVKPSAKSQPGDELIRLWEGVNVHLEFKPNSTEKEPQVGFTFPDGTYCTIDYGVVFVMNSAGKTVETFRLKDSEWF